MDKYQITLQTFDKLAHKYQDKYMDLDFYHDTYDVFCNLIAHANAEIFEIGCGPGNIAKYLLSKQLQFQITGIDLSPAMVQLARHNNPGAQFQVMDCRDIAVMNHQFDGVMCGFCLPYLAKEDVRKLISDVSGLLKHNGIFHLSTMEDDEAKSGYQSGSTGDQVYIHYYAANFLTTTLEEHGFEVTDLRRKAFPAQLGTPATDLFITARKCCNAKVNGTTKTS